MPRLKKLDVGQGEAKSNELMSGLQKNNMLLNIFRGLANSPAALDWYLKFSGALKETKLDNKTREAIALVVGQSNRCDYCVSAHTFLGGKAGMDEAAIKDAR